MRTLLLLLALFGFACVGHAQTWKTIKPADFQNPVGLYWWGEERSRFEINPNNNWVWMIRSYSNYHLDDTGTYFKVASDVHPNLNSSIYYNSISFKNDTVYMLDHLSGLYRFVDDWEADAALVNGVSSYVDEDTIWIGADNSTNAYKYIPSLSQLISLSYEATDIRAQNGILWYVNDDSYIYRYYSGPIGVAHSSDTSALLGVPRDFKFKPGTDSMFVATNYGISIANADYFVDSITPANTSNMPSASVLEFEFDSNNNIWALFGTDMLNITHLGYLDRSTGQWSMVYDGNNSPIDFSRSLSIELDNLGNVWVSEKGKLHILQVNAPTWLGLNSNERVYFTVYPNPSSGEINILVDKSVEILELEILDVLGRKVASLPFTNSFSLEEPSGIYYLNLIGVDGVLGMEKIVIR